MAEPVTTEEAKAQCRMVEDDSEDTFIESLIAPARAYVERIARVMLVAGSRTESFRAWGNYLEIWRRPIASVDSITYGPDGTGTAFEGFQVNVGAFPVRIHASSDGTGFPELADGDSIIVTLTTGAIDEDSEDYLIAKRAILLLIGHWFENREAAVIGETSAPVEFALKEMLDAIRPMSVY